MSNCQEWTAARPIPEGMTIFCLVSFTTGAVRSAMPATAGFLVVFFNCPMSMTVGFGQLKTSVVWLGWVRKFGLCWVGFQETLVQLWTRRVQQQRLRSMSRHLLDIGHYQLSTLGRRAFTVAATTSVWNSLPDDRLSMSVR